MPGDGPAPQPKDRLERDLAAEKPNHRWAADIIYVDAGVDFVCGAFVMDLFSRRVASWTVAEHMRADLALDALEMAAFSRRDHISDDLVHHSDYAEETLIR